MAPYIADKAEPTFMDAFLLGRDVSRWKRPAEMTELNALETALLVGAKGGIAAGSEEARMFSERLRQRGRDELVRPSPRPQRGLRPRRRRGALRRIGAQ